MILVSVLPGCADGRPGAESTTRSAAIYRTVILDVVDRSGADLEGVGDIPVLFIEALGADGIPLEVQIEVVAGFVDQYEIRFIDARDEAIEIDLPRQPVRAGSLLIGLGPVLVDEFAGVRAEVYTSTDEIHGYGYMLIDRGQGVWDLSGNPVPVEPEGLVLAP